MTPLVGQQITCVVCDRLVGTVERVQLDTASTPLYFHPNCARVSARELVREAMAIDGMPRTYVPGKPVQYEPVQPEGETITRQQQPMLSSLRVAAMVAVLVALLAIIGLGILIK